MNFGASMWLLSSILQAKWDLNRRAVFLLLPSSAVSLPSLQEPHLTATYTEVQDANFQASLHHGTVCVSDREVIGRNPLLPASGTA